MCVYSFCTRMHRNHRKLGGVGFSKLPCRPTVTWPPLLHVAGLRVEGVRASTAFTRRSCCSLSAPWRAPPSWPPVHYPSRLSPRVLAKVKDLSGRSARLHGLLTLLAPKRLEQVLFLTLFSSLGPAGPLAQHAGKIRVSKVTISVPLLHRATCSGTAKRLQAHLEVSILQLHARSDFESFAEAAGRTSADPS